MINNSRSHIIPNENFIQNQGEIVRLIKEQGSLEPICYGCQNETCEPNNQSHEILNLQDCLNKLSSWVEQEEEKVHLDILHVDSIKTKLGNIAKGFVFIANKYSKLSQNIMDFEKNVSYNCEFVNYGKDKIQYLIESLKRDQSEQNYRLVLRDYESIQATYNNNPLILVDENQKEIRQKYLHYIEDYANKLKIQLDVCCQIADKILNSLNPETFTIQFQELLYQQGSDLHLNTLIHLHFYLMILSSYQKYQIQYINKEEIQISEQNRANQSILSEKLEQIQNDLNTSQLQKQSVNTFFTQYINLQI